MNTTLEHQDLFLPPKPQVSVRAFVLALLAHLMLLLALTWGVSWHQQAELESSTAELWSNTPNLTQQAAPPVVQAPEPVHEPTPPPAPPQTPKPVPEVKPPLPAQADIGIEKLKKQKQLEEDKKALEKKAVKDKLEKEQAKEKEKEKEKEKAKEREKQTLKDNEKKRVQEARAQDRRVQENLKRFGNTTGMNAGPTSASNLSNGVGSGHSVSANYAGKIVELIKRNWGLHKEYTGQPKTEVEVFCAPDGTILNKKITKSSGNADWDEAVIKAIDQTQLLSKLPRDTDGRVPSDIIITLSP